MNTKRLAPRGALAVFCLALVAACGGGGGSGSGSPPPPTQPEEGQRAAEPLRGGISGMILIQEIPLRGRLRARQPDSAGSRWGECD
jgi:hypothetical protein